MCVWRGDARSLSFKSYHFFYEDEAIRRSFRAFSTGHTKYLLMAKAPSCFFVCRPSTGLLDYTSGWNSKRMRFRLLSSLFFSFSLLFVLCANSMAVGTCVWGTKAFYWYDAGTLA